MRAGYPLVLERRALLINAGHQDQGAENGWGPGPGHRWRGGKPLCCSLDTFSPSLLLPASRDKQGLWD